MGAERIDARRGVGPVDAASGSRERDPVVAERIFRPRIDVRHDLLSLPTHLLLDGDRDVPRGMAPQLLNRKLARRRRPIRPSDADRVRTDESAVAKEEEHPLRDVHEDPVAEEERDDVAVVDREDLSRLEPARVPVRAREQHRVDPEPRSDEREGVPLPNRVGGLPPHDRGVSALAGGSSGHGESEHESRAESDAAAGEKPMPGGGPLVSRTGHEGRPVAGERGLGSRGDASWYRRAGGAHSPRACGARRRMPRAPRRTRPPAPAAARS